MAVIRIAQSGDDEQLLANLPVIHDVGTVVVQRGFIDIAGVGASIRIQWIHGIWEGIDTPFLPCRLSWNVDSCSLTVFIVIVGSDGDIVLVMRHHTDRCLHDIIHAIEVVKVEMTVGEPPSKDIIIYIGVMLRLVEAHVVVRAACLLLPVDAEVIAPCIFCCNHSDGLAAAESAKRCILLQVLRLTICRDGDCLVLADRKLGTCTHRVAVAIVLHGRAISVVEERSGLAPSIGEVHIRSAAEVACGESDAVVVLMPLYVDPRALGRQTHAPAMGDLRDDVDDAADGICTVACRT